MGLFSGILKPNFRLTSDRSAQSMLARFLALIILAFALTALPHFLRMPIALTAYILGVLALKFLCLHKGYAIKAWQLIVTSVVYLIGVVAIYGRISGHEAGSVFLMGMLAVKLLESHSHRDLMICVFLAYFLAAINFLFTQSIPTAIWMIIQVILITFCLISINQTQRPTPIKSRVRLAGLTVIQAIPITVILFVLFPRIPGPLWSIPEQGNKAKTGFSNTMQPGQVSELAQSGGTAFRVSFNGDVPPQNQLYWRGLTLWKYDGTTWGQLDAYRVDSNIQRPTKRQALNNASNPIKYTVTLEPHNNRSLFTLDMPTAYEHSDNKYKLRLDDLYQLSTDKDIIQIFQYAATSQLTYTQGLNLPRFHAIEARYIPKQLNPKAQALSQQWRAQIQDDTAIVQKALAYFREENFSYSLTPPLLTNESNVDQFLFETREGFCEHFSSAFVVLMRGAGIPSRIVVGYQGGEKNPITGDVTIRQSDAHAWAEVWLKDQGWVRVDPTSAVAPERIQLSLANAVPEEDLGAVPIFSRRATSRLKPLVDLWDAIDSNWNKLVLGYGPKKQEKFLRSLGIKNLTQAVIWMVTLTGLGLGLFVFFAFRAKTNSALLGIDKQFNQLCEAIQKHTGITKTEATPALTYMKQVANAYPELKTALHGVAREYNAMRYQPDAAVEIKHNPQRKKTWVAQVAMLKRRVNQKK